MKYTRHFIHTIKSTNKLSRSEEKLVEINNNYVCCALQEDLREEVEHLAKESQFDYLIMESTGISKPISIAQTFSFMNKEKEINLSKFSHVDTMVTAINTFNFFNNFGNPKTLIGRELTKIEGGNLAIVDLLTDQIEFVNVILNKVDLITKEHFVCFKSYN
ncbi:GTP-binding protein [Tenacibaculum sp. C7A-26P2]|uniref:GTP-binding protein n=1 Tax=Tenacibaculum sp. C7A-26P2 TaxID=3447504 RepID=UPI003F85C6C6